jgi:hypothetical protein
MTTSTISNAIEAINEVFARSVRKYSSGMRGEVRGGAELPWARNFKMLPTKEMP